MSIFRKRPASEPETDLVAYARTHVTSPGAHALLDEVERGRARQAGIEEESMPSQYEAAPGAFQPLPLDRYVAWLRGYLQSGGRITHVYDYPYARGRFLLATRDFTTGGECGSAARQILVPAGVRHLGGDLGHCSMYFEDGHTLSGRFVPAYSEPEFADLPGYAEVAAEAQAQRAAFEARHRAYESERRERVTTSDLSAHVQAGDA
jgi:hypothetical protein